MLNEIDLSRADLNLLTLFEVVLQEGNVSRAADRLSLSPSAVSHGLSRLRRLLNDPLFIRTPKGVVPSARAVELSEPIAEALHRLRAILASAEPFNPSSSTRRFIVGAPDGVSAVFLQDLLNRVTYLAPGVNIGLRQLLPLHGERSPDRLWRNVFVDLESKLMDVAVIPANDVPARFEHQTLYEEDFVLVTGADHPLVADPSLDQYCEAQHLVVSLAGDPFSFVDEVLAREGRKRRVSLTVPNFMFALAVLADTGLVAALPRKFAKLHAARFGLLITESPLGITAFNLRAIAPKAALMDAGLAWFFNELTALASTGPMADKCL